ncbi:phage tail spike protein [Xylocopilactobacillus apis]|uniref:Phage minor structural protein, N-terminal region n=1 Tax=Xylocopilactobacillus apis TaxID=2932183 RepID=A0AAU9CSB1_9LACO|nr:phage tail spike protein [Xylocopilactobacillus apis]BDR56872.1 hypothetical protein KIMC2_14340 [Xylocopilactobacillus apis]
MATDFLDYPKLYTKASDDLTTGGLGEFVEATWSIKAASDGFPVLTMNYPSSGRLAKQLKLGYVIMADAGWTWHRQLFRIDSIEPVISDDTQPMFTITATHISADISTDVLSKDVKLVNSTPDSIFHNVLDNLAEPLPQATINTDIFDTASVNWLMTDGKQIQDLMFGNDNDSMKSLFYGEWFFDNYNYNFKHSAGRDTGLVVEYGSNVLSYQEVDQLTDTYTGVVPFAKFTPDPETDSGGDPNDPAKPDPKKIKDYDGVADVQYVGPTGAPIYTTPFSDQKLTGQKLKNGTYYKVLKVVDDGGEKGHTWYCLGTNQWIDAVYLTFDKDGAYIATKCTGIGTVGYNLDNPESKRRVTRDIGVLTVQYTGRGGVAIWNSPFNPKSKTGTYLSNGKYYKVSKEATDEKGHKWYCLGTNQWIDEQYVTFSKNGDYIYNAVTGFGTVSADEGTAVWTNPGHYGKKTKRVLKKGTRWKIFAMTTEGAETWYSLGNDQWVLGKDFSFSDSRDVEPKAPDDKEEENPSGKIPVWTTPGKYQHKTGQYLNSGTQWKILAKAEAGDGTWYCVGKDQWVNGSYITFKQPTDVEPKEPEQDLTNENKNAIEEVTVTLPETYITGYDANKYERQRLVAFDASEYNVKTVEQLRAVTNAYIIDNHIGKLNYSITVSYQEMTGELANLSHVGLFDIVTVHIEPFDVHVKGEVIEVNWDGNNKRNASVTIGNRPATITHQLQRYADEVSKTVTNTVNTSVDNKLTETQSKIDDAKGQATHAQISADGKSTIYYGENPPSDAIGEDGDTYFQISKDPHKPCIMWLKIKGHWVQMFAEGYDTALRDQVKQANKEADDEIRAAGFENAQKLYEAVSDHGDKITTIRAGVQGIQTQVTGFDHALAGTQSDLNRVQSQITQLPDLIDAKITANNNGLTARISESVSNGLARITLSAGSATSYNDAYIQLSNDGRTSQVNLGGDMIHITGQTLIDDAIIQSSKIANLDAGKITTGELRGINLIGAEHVTLSNGSSNVDISPWGMTLTGDSPHIQIGSDYQHGNLKVFGDANVTNNLAVDGQIIWLFNRNAYIRVDAQTGALWYHGGPGWSHNYKINMTEY